MQGHLHTSERGNGTSGPEPGSKDGGERRPHTRAPRMCRFAGKEAAPPRPMKQQTTQHPTCCPRALAILRDTSSRFWRLPWAADVVSSSDRRPPRALAPLLPPVGSAAPSSRHSWVARSVRPPLLLPELRLSAALRAASANI